MKFTLIFSITCFGFNILTNFILGLIYLIRPQFMPYHSKAVKASWVQVDTNYQALIIGLMKAIGGAWLSIALAQTAILIFAFNQSWMIWGLPVISLTNAIIALIATLIVKVKTNANTPWQLSILSIVILLIGTIARLI